MTPRRHTAWPTDRGWPAILDSQYANRNKPPLAHSPPQHSPQLLRRAPIRSERKTYWLPIFGAASGMVWSGILALMFGWHVWLIAPVIVGAVSAAIFEAS